MEYEKFKGNEEELEEEFQEMDVDILGITETKKKGMGIYKTKAGNTMIYSGVPENIELWLELDV